MRLWFGLLTDLVVPIDFSLACFRFVRLLKSVSQWIDTILRYINFTTRFTLYNNNVAVEKRGSYAYLFIVQKNGKSCLETYFILHYFQINEIIYG